MTDLRQKEYVEAWLRDCHGCQRWKAAHHGAALPLSEVCQKGALFKAFLLHCGIRGRINNARPEALCLEGLKFLRSESSNNCSSCWGSKSKRPCHTELKVTRPRNIFSRHFYLGNESFLPTVDHDNEPHLDSFDE